MLFPKLAGKSLARYLNSWRGDATELESCVVCVGICEGDFSDPLRLEAAKGIFTTSTQRHFVAVSSAWFFTNLTTERGKIRQCYIAEYDAGTRKVQ